MIHGKCLGFQFANSRHYRPVPCIILLHYWFLFASKVAIPKSQRSRPSDNLKAFNIYLHTHAKLSLSLSLSRFQKLILNAWDSNACCSVRFIFYFYDYYYYFITSFFFFSILCHTLILVFFPLSTFCTDN